MKEGNLIVKRQDDDSIVKRINISHPNIRKVNKEKERILKHFNPQVFYIDDSDFQLLYIEQGLPNE